MRPFSLFSLTVPLLLSRSTNAAAINSISNLLLVANPDAPTNTSLQTTFQPSNTLPPLPYICPIPPADATTVTITSYYGPLSKVSALACLLVATEDVADAFAAAIRDQNPDPKMQPGSITIDAEHATLVLATVGGRMSWTTVWLTLRALTAFLNSWEFEGVRFQVDHGGVGVGFGWLIRS